MPPAPPALSLRILVIEDDLRMLDLLRKTLWEHGHTVMAASDGVSGLCLAHSHVFDAIVLDIGLPGIDGYQIAAGLRAGRCDAAILMLTARDLEDDVLRGFELGADDYIRKPFSLPELLARLISVTRTTTRRPSPGNDFCYNHLRYEDLHLDLRKRSLSRASEPIHLSRSEFVLMEALMQHAGTPIRRSAVISKLWGAEVKVTPGALDTLVNALRIKLVCCSPRTLIRTIRGVGYCLERNIEHRNPGIEEGRQG